MRNFKIIWNRYKEVPLRDFLGLLRQAMFNDVQVFVYQYDLFHSSSLDWSSGEIVCRKGVMADLERAEQVFSPLPWEFQCHKFDGVEDFFVAVQTGGIQHISWIYRDSHPNRLLSLGEREAEIKFCLTLPAWRGKGIYPRVIHAILEHLRLAGIERVFMCVHTENTASIRGIEKAGFVRVMEMRLRKILGIQLSPRYDTRRRVS